MGFSERLKWLTLENVVDAVLLLSIFIFLLYFFKPELLLWDVQTVGGDTAAHYYYAWYAHHVLLPQGKLIAWEPYHMMGYPVFQYYFPLGFYIAAILGYLIGLNVAFKISTVLGIFLLPFVVYFAMRLMKFRFPAPVLAALFMLVIMFTEINKHNSVYIQDNLSGQVSEMLSLVLMLLFLGLIYSQVMQKKFKLYPSAVFGGVIIAHAMLTPFFAVLQSTYLILLGDRKLKTLKYLFLVFVLGFLLVAFWAFPFIFDTNFEDAKKVAKEINADYFAGMMDYKFYAMQALALVGIVFTIRNKDRNAGYIVYGMIILAVLTSLSLVSSHQLNLPIFSRYYPIYHVYSAMVAAYGVSELLRLTKKNYAKCIAALLIAALVFWGITSTVKIIPVWIKWNYEGVAVKQYYPQFMELNSYLRDAQFEGRVETQLMYATGYGNSLGGGPFVWDLIPEFSGKPITGTGTQGLYSLTFSIMEMHTFGPSGLFTRNADNFYKQSRMLNVKYFLKGTHDDRGEPLNIENMEKYFELKKTIPFDGVSSVEVWESKVNDGKYVYVPDFEPIRITNSSGRVSTILDWFSRPDLVDVPIVFREGAAKHSAPNLDSLPRIPVENNCSIEDKIGVEEYEFRTSCLGKPHVVKISYHPGWRIQGADAIYPVGPNLMLVYPKQGYVHMSYGQTVFGFIGTILSILGLVFLLLLLIPRVSRKIYSLLGL
ncbi:hypothetical protein HY991_02010 [Candidatus Micrarchaeota archaeon]|nr:hypothetical protein [Candidatus Micrarchaeota archaeon]